MFIDKPAGVSSQAADPDRPDDIVTRLKSWLTSEGRDAYLGTHQRLDRDTSGLLVYARKKEANASLAKQFEGRTAKKMYLACVSGWKRGPAALRDRLAPGDDGTMKIVGERDTRGQLAVTHVKVVKQKAERAIVELGLETGRTHQARAQLANAKAPIAGDVLYGGGPAPRLLLHAHALEILHPLTGKKLRVEAPVPVEFEQWLERGDLGPTVYDDDATIDRALERALEKRWGLGRSKAPHETTAFRIVNEAGDALPGLSVDAYGAFLVAQLHTSGEDDENFTPARKERVLDRLHALGFDGIYLKLRPKQASTLVETRREDVAPKLPVRGGAAPEVIVVKEEGLSYEARLADGLSTGIFLDQRANRTRVRTLAKGLRVANLFSYSCAFTVAAAAGGAKETVSVDASVVALERGRENVMLVDGIDAAAHSFVAEDAFAWLAKAARQKQRFDLVILDPPSYSTTKTRRFVASEDYAELAADALQIVAPGGMLLACTNHRGVRKAKLRRMLGDAGRKVKREIVKMRDLPDPSDFPAAPGAESHLKSILVHVK